MARARHRPRGQRGFGTMEALVASTLSLIVALAIMGFFDAQQRAYASVSTYAASQNVTRTVVDLMSREIRMSSYDPTLPASAGALPLSPGPTCPNVEEGLVQAQPQRIRIQQDLDGSGVIDQANEDITYAQQNDAITRTDRTGTTVTLVENVPPNGFRIRYFDNQANPVEIVPAGMPAVLTPTQRACVQKVVLEVRASIDNPYPNGADLHSAVRSGVTIRNRWISTSF
jgi:type II secretory pathway component PulJ